MAPIHPSVAVVVPLSLDIGHRSSHTDQCIETSAVTSTSETPAQESCISGYLGVVMLEHILMLEFWVWGNINLPTEVEDTV